MRMLVQCGGEQSSLPYSMLPVGTAIVMFCVTGAMMLSLNRVASYRNEEEGKESD